MKISTRARILAAIVGSGIVVASSACGVDATAPTQAPAALKTPERLSQFVPTEASKSLVGVADGVYVVTFNPARDQHFALGPNHLDIPANAVCDLVTSGYGPRFWNSDCTPESKPVTLTVTIKGANSDSPVVDFQPAMRFNPKTNVSLYFYVEKVSKAKAKDWVILYCGRMKDKKCVDESLTDTDLQTYVDYNASVLFRRIKHFSAYAVQGGYLMTE